MRRKLFTILLALAMVFTMMPETAAVSFAAITPQLPEGFYIRDAQGHDPRYLKPDSITEDKLKKISALQAIAEERGEPLSQMALAWVLRDPVVTSALIGASSPRQVLENVKAAHACDFTEEQLKRIDEIVG